MVVNHLMIKNLDSNRLNFTIDLASSVQNSDVVFIAVGTPSRRGDGFADLSYVYSAAKEIGINGTPPCKERERYKGVYTLVAHHKKACIHTRMARAHRAVHKSNQ